MSFNIFPIELMLYAKTMLIKNILIVENNYSYLLTGTISPYPTILVYFKCNKNILKIIYYFTCRHCCN
jgi:hypothetical protein